MGLANMANLSGNNLELFKRLNAMIDSSLDLSMLGIGTQGKYLRFHYSNHFHETRIFLQICLPANVIVCIRTWSVPLEGSRLPIIIMSGSIVTIPNIHLPNCHSMLYNISIVLLGIVHDYKTVTCLSICVFKGIELW